MNLLTFDRLLELYRLDPQSLRLVRHSEKEIKGIINVFKNDKDKFEAYQSFQGRPIYGEAKHIAVFASHTGTSALFLGIWKVGGYTSNSLLTKKHHKMIDKYEFTQRNGFKKDWHKTASWYDLKYNDVMSEFSTRLVIDWGKSRSWVQSKDKDILEIRPLNSVGDFVSYDSVNLTYRDLKLITENPNSNSSWLSALKAVRGIYLIRDTSQNRIYVGSASGKDGFWGRWRNYANTGHGGNLRLVACDANEFTFSILEIVSATFSETDIFKREDAWKEKLGARSEENLCGN